MPKEVGVFDPEQLNALQDLFDEVWMQLTESIAIGDIPDWGTLRDRLAMQIMELAQSNLTDNEIIQAVLSSLGLQ
jgi:hypothetical protein